MIGLDQIQQSKGKPKGVAGRDFVSWSQLSTFRTCPLKYYFRYVARLPPEFVSSSLVFGSAIHRAIEFHHRQQLEGLEPPSLDLLLSEFWDEWKLRTSEAPEIRFGKSEDVNSIGQLADRVLVAFIDSDIANPPGNVIAIEEEFRGAVLSDYPEFLGYVDLVLDTGDELVARDYKTSRSKWNQGTAETSAEQILLYGEMVKDLLPDKKLRLEFAVITKTKSPSLDLYQVQSDVKRVRRTRQVATRTLDAIRAGVFYPNASAMNCSTCPFRSACAAWS